MDRSDPVEVRVSRCRDQMWVEETRNDGDGVIGPRGVVGR